MACRHRLVPFCCGDSLLSSLAGSRGGRCTWVKQMQRRQWAAWNECVIAAGSTGGDMGGESDVRARSGPTKGRCVRTPRQQQREQQHMA